MIINNLVELNRRRTLKLGSNVIFHINNEDIKYKVQKDYLRNIKIIQRHDYIFNILDLDYMKLAKDCYGYSPYHPSLYLYKQSQSSFWPISKKNDYRALTRLVKRLYKIIEDKYLEGFFDPILSRFEIIDL